MSKAASASSSIVLRTGGRRNQNPGGAISLAQDDPRELSRGAESSKSTATCPESSCRNTAKSEEILRPDHGGLIPTPGTISNPWRATSEPGQAQCRPAWMPRHHAIAGNLEREIHVWSLRPFSTPHTNGTEFKKLTAQTRTERMQVPSPSLSERVQLGFR